MPLLLVTYDLNGHTRDYSDLLETIKGYSNVQLSESSYAIITDKVPSRVCDELKKCIGKNDTIFVINLKRPYDGYGSKLVNDWLKKELRD